MDYNVEWAEETKRMIDLEGNTSKVVQADVTDEESCQSAVAQTVKAFGTIDVLVNIGKNAWKSSVTRRLSFTVTSWCGRRYGRCHEA